MQDGEIKPGLCYQGGKVVGTVRWTYMETRTCSLESLLEAVQPHPTDV